MYYRELERVSLLVGNVEWEGPPTWMSASLDMSGVCRQDRSLGVCVSHGLAGYLRVRKREKERVSYERLRRVELVNF